MNITEERNYKIYLHINKINDKKYVGQTRQSVEHRWNNGYGYLNSPYFWNAIQKYGWDNFEHIVLMEGLTKTEADEKEIELIKNYKSHVSEHGYNISRGGSGLTGATKYIDIYKYNMDGSFVKHYFDISEIIEENPEYSASCIRYCYDEKSVSAYGFQWKSYYKDYIEEVLPYNYRRSKEKCKNVYQYSLNGEYITSYNSITQAANINNLDDTCIGKCCNELMKSYAGYQWKLYYSEIIQSLEYTICYYNLDGILLGKFNSAIEASEATGLNKSNIINCYQGRYDLCGNYIWVKYNHGEPIKEIIDVQLKKVTLIQWIDDDGICIKTFPSAKAAAKELGFKDAGGIIKVCDGLREKTHGYRFKYKLPINI